MTKRTLKKKLNGWLCPECRRFFRIEREAEEHLASHQ